MGGKKGKKKKTKKAENLDDIFADFAVEHKSSNGAAGQSKQGEAANFVFDRVRSRKVDFPGAKYEPFFNKSDRLSELVNNRLLSDKPDSKSSVSGTSKDIVPLQHFKCDRPAETDQFLFTICTRGDAMGRRAVAINDIEPVGSLMVRERPLVWIVLDAEKRTACHGCAKAFTGEETEVQECKQCSAVYYCSAKCRAGHQSLHSWECPVLADIDSIAKSTQLSRDLVRIGMRYASVVVQASQEQDDGKSPCSPKLFQADLRAIDALVGHMELMSAERIDQLEAAARLLCNTAGLESQFSQNADGYTALIKRVAAAFPKCNSNAHALTHPITQAVYGLGLFPLCAIFNHSCYPNCVFVSEGDALCIRTLRPVKAGEQLFVSYVSLSMPRYIRRRELKVTKKFHCECPRCSLSPIGEEEESSFVLEEHCTQVRCQAHQLEKLAELIGRVPLDICDNRGSCASSGALTSLLEASFPGEFGAANENNAAGGRKGDKRKKKSKTACDGYYRLVGYVVPGRKKKWAAADFLAGIEPGKAPLVVAVPPSAQPPIEEKGGGGNETQKKKKKKKKKKKGGTDGTAGGNGESGSKALAVDQAPEFSRGIYQCSQCGHRLWGGDIFLAVDSLRLEHDRLAGAAAICSPQLVKDLHSDGGMAGEDPEIARRWAAAAKKKKQRASRLESDQKNTSSLLMANGDSRALDVSGTWGFGEGQQIDSNQHISAGQGLMILPPLPAAEKVQGSDWEAFTKRLDSFVHPLNFLQFYARLQLVNICGRRKDYRSKLDHCRVITDFGKYSFPPNFLANSDHHIAHAQAALQVWKSMKAGSTGRSSVLRQRMRELADEVRRHFGLALRTQVVCRGRSSAGASRVERLWSTAESALDRE